MSNLKLDQRSYSGKCFRPKPLVEVEPQSNTTLVVTSWNSADPGARVMQLMKDFLVLTGDPEATSAGSYIEGLGPMANRLRSAALLANENLYVNDNRSEYVAGVEMAAVSVQNNIMSWVQIGAPHLLVVNEKGFQPLCYTPDWAWQIQQDTPLLCQGLGLEKTVNLHCGSYRLQGGEKLVLISRSQIPSALYGVKKVELDRLAQTLASDEPETPFWIGVQQF